VSRVIDLTGRTFGRLTVLERAENDKGRQTRWRCQCKCGETTTVRGARLRSGKTRSCGCLALEASRKLGLASVLPNGDAGFNTVFARYKRNAKRRGLVFDLSAEEFRSLTRERCTYCHCKTKAVEQRCPNSICFTYNGIERIDSDLGYTVENCVPCCWPCNRAKGSLSLEAFLAKQRWAIIKRVLRYAFPVGFWRRRSGKAERKGKLP